jgi:biopolymer transport protein ExbB
MIGEGSVWTVFSLGGPVMWPLLACSIVALAIIADRAWFFSRHRLDYRWFMRELGSRLSGKPIDDAIGWCGSLHHPIAKVAATYLAHVDRPDQMREEALTQAAAWELERVEARLHGLSAIAHVAPLLGLLGTVTGLVTAFHRIETLGGIVQPADLAGGIWEALLTTVFGLTIAIPCMLSYHFFEHRADAIARRIELAVSELNQRFGRKRSSLSGLAATPDDAMTTVP